MKQTFVLLLAVLLLPTAAFADDCNCTAPDRSCSTSISCSGGCWSICPSGGGCASGCSGGGGSGWNPENKGGLTVAPDDSGRILSLSAQGLTATDISAMLGQYLGKPVEFAPLDPAALFSIDVGRMPTGEFLKVLSQFGAIATRGKKANNDSTPRLQVPEAEVSIKLKRTTAGELAALLGQFLAGSDYALRAGDPQEELSLDVEHADLRMLLQGLQATTSLRLVSIEK